MTCEQFSQRLDAYVRGDLQEPAFGDCVEHEARCSACRDLVLERWEAVSSAPPGAALAPASTVAGSTTGDSTAADLTGGAAGSHVAGADFSLEQVLARTIATDCHYIELRIAEALDDELSPEQFSNVREHLHQCAACRRMREILSELPEWYALFPVLDPDRAFVRSVLDRTIGAQPGFFDVLRALWRRPEAVFEAAVACALITALLFGRSQPQYDEITDQAERAVSEQIQRVLPERAGVHGVRDLLIHSGASVAELLAPRDGYIRRQADHAYDSTVKISSWMERARTDIRNGDYQALLRELEPALRPLGLYPKEKAEEKGQSHE